ncbi:MAG: cupin domain-containing protein [Hyphomicrobium aestuarii]|nr:cupin domain-containing protein [Hyphomicrobium aestuarii]
MAGPVINMADLELKKIGNGAGFEAEIASFGGMIGSKELDCRFHVVEPGKKAYPRHSHHREHELFVILEGEGTYRFGDVSYPIRAGDVCAGPTGGPETARQIVNTGSRTLKYLAIGTKAESEVCEHPDSGKVLIWSSPDWAAGVRVEHIFAKDGRPLGYYDGEA